ncbi:MAG: hypothetical protein L0170_04425, partial [Acidobacteria bacterium]|nr:hypothetical protein [Acidobacteriota bacterium]
VSDLSPMPTQGGDLEGAIAVKLRRADHVAVELHRTIGGKMGQDAGHLDEILLRDASAPMDEPTPFFTGLHEMPIDGTADREASVLIRQDQPLPMTVLSIYQRLNVGER